MFRGTWAATLWRMPIDRDAPEPEYEQLAAIIQDKIASGEYQPGKPVPSLRLLAEEHGLALSTVQKTVRLLVEEKVLITRRGRGIYVARS